MGRRDSLTLPMAQRVALAAQGLATARPGPDHTAGDIRRLLGHIGLIQIDSVNVLARSQELVLFARLGPHSRSMIPDLTRKGRLYEYWIHEASFAPTEQFHLHRYRAAKDHQWKGISRIEQERPGFVDQVLARIRDEGPLAAGDLNQRVGKKGTWWDWDDGKYALEWLFWTGRVGATRRDNDFARLYDLIERVIPAKHLNAPVPPEPEARKELLLIATRCLGVGTLKDLADYHRQKPTAVKALVAELVEDGHLLAIRVDGWDDQAYMLPGTTIPREVSRTALLSPFDPICWYRERALRLFGFHYRIEIYTPQPKRQYGYYVLPILWRGDLVGRIDMKADRQRGVLMAKAIFAEVGAPIGEIAPDIAAELTLMADWLGLAHGVEVGDRGELAGPVRVALA